MEKCIYKIKKEQVHGSGFFAKIEKKETKNAHVLITNNHILGQDFISNNKNVITLH